MKKLTEELFDEVVTILKEKGFKLEKNNNGAEGLRTKPTKTGNYLWLCLVDGIFIPTICNEARNEGILSVIDTLVKKIIFEKFPLFSSGIVSLKKNLIIARQVAEIITRAFESYERIWKKLMSEQQLISVINGAVTRTQEEQF